MAKHSLAQGLVDQGFIRGTPEIKRAYWKLKEQRRMERDPNYREKERERWRERYHNDPEFRKKELARRREAKRKYIKNHPEKAKQLNKKRAARMRKQKETQDGFREKCRAYQQEWYQKNRDAHRERAKRNHRARQPERGLLSSIRECRDGELGIHELLRQVRESVALSVGNGRRPVRKEK